MPSCGARPNLSFSSAWLSEVQNRQVWRGLAWRPGGGAAASASTPSCPLASPRLPPCMVESRPRPQMSPPKLLWRAVAPPRRPFPHAAPPCWPSRREARRSAAPRQPQSSSPAPPPPPRPPAPPPQTATTPRHARRVRRRAGPATCALATPPGGGPLMLWCVHCTCNAHAPDVHRAGRRQVGHLRPMSAIGMYDDVVRSSHCGGPDSYGWQ